MGVGRAVNQNHLQRFSELYMVDTTSPMTLIDQKVRVGRENKHECFG